MKRLIVDTVEVRHTKTRRLDCHTTEDSNVLNINDLPYLILLKLFKYFPLKDRLKIISYVCRYWRDIMNSPSLWKSVVFKLGHKVNNEVLERLTSINPNISHVDLSDVKAITSEAYIRTICKCTQLRVLKTIRYDMMIYCILSNGLCIATSDYTLLMIGIYLYYVAFLLFLELLI